MLMLLEPVVHIFLPVKPRGDQTCWLEGEVQEDCQQNKPANEQLAAQPHQVTPVVVGLQGGKHSVADFKGKKYTISPYWQQKKAATDTNIKTKKI